MQCRKNERMNKPYSTPCSQHFHHHPQLGKSKECSPGVCFHGRASVTEGVRRRSLDFQVLVGCPHSVENDNVTITTLQQKVGLAVHFPKYLRQRSGLVEKVCWKVAYSLTKAFLRPPGMRSSLQIWVLYKSSSLCPSPRPFKNNVLLNTMSQSMQFRLTGPR